jgi:hypothetical protein
MSCSFAHDDGAYVLGALSPVDRLGFEQHLPGCADCSRTVRELAGLPGLLARVDPAVLDDPPPVEPVPDTLLPALLREVRRSRRRRVLAPLAAAAAVVATVGTLALTGVIGGGAGAPVAVPPPPPAHALTMSPVGHVPLRASVALDGVAWGTRLDMTCTYLWDEPPYAVPQATTYVLYVRTREGKVEQVGTWRSLPGKTMHITAATATSRADIASVEVRTASGKPVLELAS